MASQLLGIKTRFTNDLGSPLVGGQVYTYFAGTSTNQDSYSDAALTVPNTNPVILDDTGSADIFLKGAYRIRVFDKSGRFIEEQDNVTQAASQVDATELSNKVNAVEVDLSKVKLDTGITATAKFGGVERQQSDVNAETVSVEDFGASASNADNTTQINNANAYALSVGASVKYPNGEFKVLGDIPDLHKVQAYGSGVIVRGDNKFYIEPNNTQSNTIYIKPNGVGDGVSRNSAISIGDIIPALKNLQKRAGAGYWNIHLCDGTYANRGIRLSDVPLFNNTLTFSGDVDETGEPTTIWDGTTSTNAYALRCDLVSSSLRVYVKDIKFIKWKLSPSNAGAVVFWGGHQVTTENIVIDDCAIGIWVSRNSFHRSIGDKISNCTQWGIASQYHSSLALGTSTNRTTISNCAVGLHLGRNSVGHNDYVDYSDNNYDIYATQNSRLTSINPTMTSWNNASIYAQNLAIIENLEVCNFDAASITNETPVLFSENGAIAGVSAGKGTELLHQTFVPAFSADYSNTVADELVSSAVGFGAWTRFPRFMLYQGRKLTIKFSAYMTGSNTTDDSVFKLCANSTSQELLSLPLPSGGFGARVDVTLDFREDGAIYVTGTITSNYGVTFKTATISSNSHNAFRDKTAALTQWRAYVKMASTSDTFKYFSQKTWVTL